MRTVLVSAEGPPAIKSGRDLAWYLWDWQTSTVPNASERAESLRRIASVMWTNTAAIVERLEELAAECDPAANEPEPVEYSLGDCDGFERTVAVGDDVSHPDQFDAVPAGFDWDQEVARA